MDKQISGPDFYLSVLDQLEAAKQRRVDEVKAEKREIERRLSTDT